MFFQLLLVEVSYDCDPDEKSKDCFEFKVWHTDRYSNAPINCSSTAAINGSVEIICYEIVYNFGTAVGASYGVFKISNGALELLATLMLIRKTTTFVCKVQTVIVLALVGFVVAVFVVIYTSQWRVYLDTTNLGYISQACGTLAMAFQFAFLVPWKDLIKKINDKNSNGEQGLGSDNIAME